MMEPLSVTVIIGYRMQAAMSQDWTEQTVQRLLSRDLGDKGVCLVLGAADTGKTTLIAAMAKDMGSKRRVGIIDADVGQSHIGPPACVGWAIADGRQADFSKLAIGGLNFVGDITPVGHLLQLTAAIVQSYVKVSTLSDVILIDTPGFIGGPAATALWWTVQRILQPDLIVAVQRNDDLSHILRGLEQIAPNVEQVHCPQQMRIKSPQARRKYRQEQFGRYFRSSSDFSISLNDVAIQESRDFGGAALINRLVGLRDAKGADLTIGRIRDWRRDKGVVVVQSPAVNIRQVRCLAIGDVAVDLNEKR
jgi:polynucleotide 5'-hydroxyl-kinase GRC3/NOL9